MSSQSQHSTPAELEKKELEAQISQENFNQFQAQRKQKLEAAKLEKKESMEQLTSYQPWGRPGSGAPSRSSRRTKMDLQDSISVKTEPRNEPKTNADQQPQQQQQQQHDQFYDPFGRPGSGAPIKDSAGKVQTTRVVSVATKFSPPNCSEEDPFFGKPGSGAPIRDSNGRPVTPRTHNLVQAVRETDPKNEIKKSNNQPKWNAYMKQQHHNIKGHHDVNKEEQQQYNKELEEQARVRVAQKENEIQEEMRASIEHVEKWNSAWGKPGSGAPIRDKDGGLIANRTHNLAQTVQETDPMNEIKKFQNQPEWNTHLKQQHNNIKGHQAVNKEEQQRYIAELEDQTRAQLAQKEKEIQEERQASIKHAEKWSAAWGKPGSGAPIRDQDGGLVANRTHNLAQTVQETDPKNEIKKFQNQPQWDTHLKRQHNNIKGHQEICKEEQQQYNKELEEQARMRVAQKENETQEEMRASLEHFERLDSAWGKPGSGAPMRDSDGRPVTPRTHNLALSVQGIDPKKEVEKSQNPTLWNTYLKQQLNNVKGHQVVNKKEQQLYHKELDDQEQVRVAQKENEIQEEMRASVEHFERSDSAWGKPGSGAPMRDEDGRPVTPRIQHHNIKGQHYVNKEEQEQYNKELYEQTLQRVAQKKNERKHERRASVEHADKWNSIWGKPGAGAPLDGNRRRKFDVDIHA